MGDSRIERQLALEEESVQLGIDYYRKQVKGSDLSDMTVGMRLMENCLTPFIPAIRAFKLDTSKKQVRSLHARKFLMAIPDDEIAFIVAKRCINSLGNTMSFNRVNRALGEPIQRVAIQIANMLQDHIEYMNFKEQHPNYLAVVERNIKSDHMEHKRTVVMHAKRKLLKETEPKHKWTELDRLHIGVKCIDLFIESTGVMKKVVIDNTSMLRMADEVSEWIDISHAKCELLNPQYMPMIMPPLRWDSCFGGGFVSNDITTSMKLVKTKDSKVLLHVNEKDIPEVYAAINALQETPWRINKKVYNIMHEVWESGGSLGGMPSREVEPLPSTPWSSEEEFQQLKLNDPTVVKAWKFKASQTHQRRIRIQSKHFAMAQKMRLGEKFLDEPEIFFCWSMDWRGRMYPVQTFINPQADDSGKALLEFAKGMPLGEKGGYWLMVHIANCFGYDKCSFDDRVAWVQEHHRLIIDSAINPLDGERFWCEADDPYMFLAACLEYQGWMVEGKSFISHLPIGLDGTCNGLQNFSGMLLDKIGGEQVNLVPSDKPSDIYGKVAALVSAKVEKDAQSESETSEMAKLWVGKVDRKIAKRNVMTYVYGAKKYGFKYQLMEELSKRNTTEVKYLGIDDDYNPATYLAGLMYETIGEVVVAAKHAMDWLQQVAKIASKVDAPIVWSTPIGFLPWQAYYKETSKEISTFWGSIRLQLRLKENSSKMSRVRMTNAIAPNFVHALDASHLMKTVNRCKEMGINSFSMVHDSYGTHAANIDKLAYYLREQFVSQYSQDVLATFKKEVEEQLPEELRGEIPPLPAKGSLDLSAVMDSTYFFA